MERKEPTLSTQAEVRTQSAPTLSATLACFSEAFLAEDLRPSQ